MLRYLTGLLAFLYSQKRVNGIITSVSKKVNKPSVLVCKVACPWLGQTVSDWVLEGACEFYKPVYMCFVIWRFTTMFVKSCASCMGNSWNMG